MSLKRLRPDSPPNELYISSTIEDRDSTFIAHFSPTASAKTLQKHAELSSASHRIAAWRKPSTQKTLKAERLYDTGHDDDGEKWAGQRLERVLCDAKVEGAIVVARWYGGTMLGPVRFAHIENCAREAVGKFQGIANSNVAEVHVPEPGVKRVKTVEERNEEREVKERLVGTLRERDESVDVLRGLLADKVAGVESGVAGSQGKARPSYGGMTMDTLLRLEKARDATIGFLLKQIDEAEKKHAEKVRKTDAEDDEAWAAFDELEDQAKAVNGTNEAPDTSGSKKEGKQIHEDG